MSRLITILSADRSLTKSYHSNGQSEPYPLVRDFTSLEVSYESIEELYTAFEVVSESGSCMLKGHLTKQIKDAPRSGLTDASAPTDLLVIDYDSDGGFPTVESMLEEIDPALAETDYIFQHSSSAGIKGPIGVRGHVFILLTKPASPAMIKQWLKKVNLTSEKFSSRIKLSRNAMALCYALDITVNQNDKLIYLAKPILYGIKDPVQNRFELHTRTNRTFTFNAAVSAELNRVKEHALIEKLQDAAGFVKRTPKYKVVGDAEIITNPAACVVTQTKDCGKFVRLNLNGGDSFAYWYAKDSPQILYNFKGEPNAYLESIAPEYYNQLQESNRNKSVKPFVFRDIVSDTYYGAEYDQDTGRLIHCNKISRRQTLIDFMVQRNRPAPKVIPDWVVSFDPSNPTPVNFEVRQLNLFRPTKYLEPTVMPTKDLPPVHIHEFPTIHKVVSHVCVDTITYDKFVRWIAHIIQFRTKTQTAWIFSGVEGTGKGTLFHKILRPIFGMDHAHLITQDQAEEQYNSYLQHNMLLFLDEGDIGSSAAAEKIMARFRSIITEPTLPIRAMRSNPIQMPNFTNLIIATNRSLPIRITASDRRYNVAPRQNERLRITDEEYEMIEKELDAFVTYIKQLSITAIEARMEFKNSARDELIELSKTISDQFFEALKYGDLDFFAEKLQDSPPIPDNGYTAFCKVVEDWMRNCDHTLHISIDDLVVVYRYIGGNDKIDSLRFGHAAGRHNAKSTQKRINGVQRRVYETTFKCRDYSAWFNRKDSANKVLKFK